MQSEKRIDVYEDGAIGKLRKTLAEMEGKQPGDVAKGCKVLVEILTMTGRSEGREIPLRIPLGSDAAIMIKKKCESTIKLLNEWDDLITKTDHE